MAEPIIITIDDIQQYRKISSQVETERFEAFAGEAQRINLRGLLGESLYYDFFENYTASKYVTLKDGKSYTYNNETIQYYGLKPYVCYIWLSIFAREGDLFQANAGNVSFNSGNFGFNNPTDKTNNGVSYRQRKELEQTFMEDATNYANGIRRYLNENSGTYDLWIGDSEKKITSFNMPDPV